MNSICDRNRPEEGTPLREEKNLPQTGNLDNRKVLVVRLRIFNIKISNPKIIQFAQSFLGRCIFKTHTVFYGRLQANSESKPSSEPQQIRFTRRAAEVGNQPSQTPAAQPVQTSESRFAKRETGVGNQQAQVKIKEAIKESSEVTPANITHFEKTTSVTPGSAVSQAKDPLQLKQNIGIEFSMRMVGKSDKQRQVYFEIKNKLSNVPFVKAKFDDLNMTFTLYHQEREIESIVSYAKLRKYFPIDITACSDPSKRIYFNTFVYVSVETETVFKERQQRLLEQSETFLKTLPTKQVEFFPEQVLTKEDVVFKLLEQHEGICIGEDHEDISPKKLLIDNMAELKKRGVNKIYLEHIFHDSMQDLLDAYLKSESDQMPSYLEKYLKNLSTGHNCYDKNFNYVELIREAKKQGIRVIGIDTTISYTCGTTPQGGVEDSKERYTAMNATATALIQEEQRKMPGKYLLLVGSGHVAASLLEKEKVVGVAETLQVPSLIVQDKGENIESIAYNVKNFMNEISHVTACIIM